MLEVCVRHAYACLQLPELILPQVFTREKENRLGQGHSGNQRWMGVNFFC